MVVEIRYKLCYINADRIKASKGLTIMAETLNASNNKQLNSGITEGVIWKQMLIFFFPMLFGSILQLLYNATDAAIVGQFLGKSALSAVGGATGTIINLIVGFFIAMSSGVTVTIAQFYGAQKYDEVSKSLHTAIAFAIAAGAMVTLVGLLIAPSALIWMGVPDDVYPMAMIYIRIIFFGTIPNLIYNVGAGILRAIGDSRRPLYFLITSVVINIILDLFFIVQLELGISGAAWATIIAQTISAILVILSLSRSSGCIQLNTKQIRFYKAFLKRILMIGTPTAFQALAYSSSNMFIQSFINSFGTNTIAAWTSYAKIDGLFWAVNNTLGITLMTFVGQNYGAGKFDRVKKSVFICFGMICISAITLSTLLYNFGGYVLQLFNNDVAVLEIGIEIIHFLVPTYLTYVCVEISSSTLRGLGNTLTPLIISALGIPGIRMLWLFFGPQLFPGFKNVIFSYPLTWSITSLISILYFIWYWFKIKDKVPVFEGVT